MSNTRLFVFTPSQLAVAVVIMATVALGAVAAGPKDASGRDHSSIQSRTLEGTWRVEITLLNCQTGAAFGAPFPALASFAQGGTVTTADGGLSPAVRGTGLGTWWHAPGGGFSAVSEAFLFNSGVRVGLQRINQDIDVAVDGETFAANVRSEIEDAAGNVTMTGCATSVGRRQ